MNAPMNNKPLDILMVEDNPGDVRLTREAFYEVALRVNMHVASDGAEAVAFLSSAADNARALPDIILLDLNLPKKNGHEVLAEIKTDQRLRHIPVIVLTTSCDERDVIMAYSLYANCYIAKPLDLEQFLIVVKQIEQFWFELVQLPRSVL